MSAPAIRIEVRYRPLGDDEAAWVVKPFEVGQDVIIEEMIRGVQYEINARNVAANNRSSEWVSVPVTVSETNKTGAAAIPNISQQQSMWGLTTSVEFTATGNFDATSVATVSMTAGGLIIGSQSVSYGASSATWEGSVGQPMTLYLYYVDPELEGGSRTLYLADNPVSPANADGRVSITSISFTFPAAGDTISGGGSIAGKGGTSGSNNGIIEVPA